MAQKKKPKQKPLPRKALDTGSPRRQAAVRRANKTKGPGVSKKVAVRRLKKDVKRLQKAKLKRETDAAFRKRVKERKEKEKSDAVKSKEFLRKVEADELGKPFRKPTEKELQEDFPGFKGSEAEKKAKALMKARRGKR